MEPEFINLIVIKTHMYLFNKSLSFAYTLKMTSKRICIKKRQCIAFKCNGHKKSFNIHDYLISRCLINCIFYYEFFFHKKKGITWSHDCICSFIKPIIQKELCHRFHSVFFFSDPIIGQEKYLKILCVINFQTMIRLV